MKVVGEFKIKPITEQQKLELLKEKGLIKKNNQEEENKKVAKLEKDK